MKTKRRGPIGNRKEGSSVKKSRKENESKVDNISIQEDPIGDNDLLAQYIKHTGSHTKQSSFLDEGGINRDLDEEGIDTDIDEEGIYRDLDEEDTDKDIDEEDTDKDLDWEGTDNDIDEEDTDKDTDEEGIASQKRMRVRGGTTCYRLKNLEPGEKLPLRWNEKGQGVGRNRVLLVSYIGYLAAKRMVIPVNYKDWRSVPQHHKEELWNLLCQKFELTECNKQWVYMKMGARWRNCKYRITQQYYDIWDNDEDRLSHPPPNLPYDHWRYLVSYYGTDKWKEMRERTKKAKACQKLFPVSGRKPLENIEDDMRREIGDLNAEIPRVYTWKKAFQRPDGSTVTPAVAEAISKINAIIDEDPKSVVTGRDDCLARAIRPDRSGMVRGVGSGVTPSILFGRNAHQCNALSPLKSEIINLKQENENLWTGHGILMKQNEKLKTNQERQQKQLNMLVGLFMKKQEIGPTNTPDRSQFGNQALSSAGKSTSTKVPASTLGKSQSMRHTHTENCKLASTKVPITTTGTNQSMKHLPTPTSEMTSTKVPISTPARSQTMKKHVPTPTYRLTSTKDPYNSACRTESVMDASNLTNMASFKHDSYPRSGIMNEKKFGASEFFTSGEQNSKVPFSTPGMSQSMRHIPTPTSKQSSTKVPLKSYYRTRNSIRAPDLTSEMASIKQQEPTPKGGISSGRNLETKDFVTLDKQNLKAKIKPKQQIEIESEQECVLKDETNKTVALGVVLSDDPNTSVHHKLLGNSSYKVKLISIVRENAILPHECSFASTLAEVSVGGILAWPKMLTRLV